MRIELMIAILQTAALATWLRRLVWSGRRDSNPRHSAWEADALPLNYSRSLVGDTGFEPVTPSV